MRSKLLNLQTNVFYVCHYVSSLTHHLDSKRTGLPSKTVGAVSTCSTMSEWARCGNDEGYERRVCRDEVSLATCMPHRGTANPWCGSCFQTKLDKWKSTPCFARLWFTERVISPRGCHWCRISLNILGAHFKRAKIDL